MKKLSLFVILAYLLFTINSTADNQNSSKNNLENEKVLKIGALLPLSGKYQDVGESFLKSIQLALFDISNENIRIYPNPAGDMIFIDWPDEYKLLKECYIYNVVGERLRVFKEKKLDRLDISQLDTGVYFLELKSDQNTYTHKIIHIK